MKQILLPLPVGEHDAPLAALVAVDPPLAKHWLCLAGLVGELKVLLIEEFTDVCWLDALPKISRSQRRIFDQDQFLIGDAASWQGGGNEASATELTTAKVYSDLVCFSARFKNDSHEFETASIDLVALREIAYREAA